MIGIRRIAGLWTATRERLRRSGDREHEMLGNRLAIGTLILVYSLLFVSDRSVEGQELRLVCDIYCVGTVLSLVHPLIWPRLSQMRRLAAVFMDIGTLSYGFHLGGAIASPFFAVYLWIILGNGFRFGLLWLRLSMAASVVGFGMVVLSTSYWQNNLPLGLGLLAGLVVIPSYASRLIRTLSEAKQQAEEASKAKSLFLASISHELRTPLNAVIGMTSLMAATPLTAEQREMTGTIDAASRTLLSLIDGILDLSRIEAGRMPVTSSPFDLSDVLSGVMSLVSVRAREKGLQTALHITSRTPLDLVGDARHLSEIVLNLVSNAVKFTHGGMVVLAADAVPCSTSGCQLRIEVTDTGIGIAAEAQTRIFDAFVQADGTIINRFGGTGLGLAITSRLVTLHGGQISVHSLEGRGSTFTVLLPMALAEPAAPGLDEAAILVEAPADLELHPLIERLRSLGCVVVGPADPAASTRPPGRRVSLTAEAGRGTEGTGGVLIAEPGDGLPAFELQRRFATIVSPDAPEEQLAVALRIAARQPIAPSLSDQTIWTRPRSLRVLVADDNAVNTRVLDLVLRRAGHVATVVCDGEQALDAMEQSEFDVVLMDLNMPVMTGLEAAKLYRFGAIGRTHLPIIGLTADVTNEVQRRCDEAGMDRCLLKPIEPRTLLDAVDAVAAPGSLPSPAANILPEAVTDIASHPRYRGNAAAVDMATVTQLRDLGGDDFLEGLIGDFLTDARRLQATLAQAARSGDMESVAAEAHALYSAAGNMGAEPVRQICRTLQSLSLAELPRAGEQLLGALSGELVRVTRALEALHRDGPTAGVGAAARNGGSNARAAAVVKQKPVEGKHDAG